MSTSNHIRPMQLEDLDKVRSWRNHPEVAQYMLNSEAISEKDHAAWFQRSQHLAGRHLLIFDNGQAQGFVQFNAVDASDVADWGFYMAPDSPRGHGLQLGRSALHYAFSELALHKVCGQVLSSNPRSIAFHEKLGFVQEGQLREQHQQGPVHLDLLCFGLLCSEWQTETSSSTKPHED